ncbi:hypothetical protein LTR70_000816 [Exophiala xenobiotica]|uniref:Uncharacterized protein n=1 Tax=Lithohypha guttulata TaxID=1690604 RepID=A0ABR0KND4_9EURO|nr:hypothetical protein LTR24_000511 [Lithohypha guttulata]KAK5329319.1 hypothetical protein LTR70_000816 [Exophiala xenobiotica]
MESTSDLSEGDGIRNVQPTTPASSGQAIRATIRTKNAALHQPVDNLPTLERRTTPKLARWTSSFPPRSRHLVTNMFRGKSREHHNLVVQHNVCPPRDVCNAKRALESDNDMELAIKSCYRSYGSLLVATADENENELEV